MLLSRTGLYRNLPHSAQQAEAWTSLHPAGLEIVPIYSIVPLRKQEALGYRNKAHTAALSSNITMQEAGCALALANKTPEIWPKCINQQLQPDPQKPAWQFCPSECQSHFSLAENVDTDLEMLAML